MVQERRLWADFVNFWSFMKAYCSSLVFGLVQGFTKKGFVLCCGLGLASL
jgi:hypothetical protein